MSDPPDAIPLPEYDLTSDLQWRTRGLDEAQREAMARAELTPEEAARWRAVGITCPRLAWGWKVRGVAPDAAAVWHRAGFLPSETDTPRAGKLAPDDLPLDAAEKRRARELGVALDRVALLKRNVGCDVEEAAAWAAVSFHPDASVVAAWRALGVAAAEAEAWYAAGPRRPDQVAPWLEAGFTPETARPWHALAADPAAAAELAAAGVAPADPDVRRILAQATAWREAGVDLGAAAAWIRGRLSPAEARGWTEAGFTADEAVAWANKDRSRGPFGSAPEEARTWTELGAGPEQALEARRRGLRPEHVPAWTAVGFSLEEALAARPAPPERAAAYREAGVPAAEIGAWLHLGRPEQVAAARAAGLDADAARGWRQRSFTLDAAAAWRAAGLDLEAATAWRAAGATDPAAAAAAAAGGLTPDDWARGGRYATRPEARGPVAILFWGLPFPDSADRPPWDGPEDVFAWRARFLARGAGRRLEDVGCKVDVYGQAGVGGDFALPYAAVAASEVRRGAPGSIAPPPVGDDWEERLRTFCDVLGLPWSEPGWHVVALHAG